ncbi:hypothetical protein G9A89_018405 [Geosiphon pyriformis]|nr:hypothetical protein G9A89_018405 [Geosiphon pyriformis]
MQIKAKEDCKLQHAINILSTDASTSNVTSTLRHFSFQSKQQKAELLRPYGNYFEGFKLRSPMPSGFRSPLPQLDFRNIKEEEEEKSEDQEFTYQNPIIENSEFRTPNF